MASGRMSVIISSTRYYTPKEKTRTETVNVNLGVNLQEVMHDVRAGIDSMFCSRTSPLFVKNVIFMMNVPFDEFQSSMTRDSLKSTLACLRETVICDAKYSRPSASRPITSPLVTVSPPEPSEKELVK